MYAVRLQCLILHPATKQSLGKQTITVEVDRLGKEQFIQAARERFNSTNIRVLSYRLVGITN